jgi:L-proline amide hydrolase
MEARAEFEGHETWYRVEGELGGGGPAPLVLIHGGPGGSHDYLLPLLSLARGRAVVLYDQLGCGNSTHLPERGADFWTVELYLRQLDALIDHLGIGGAYHVLGHSWGGCLAQEHAITRPLGLRSLVLSDTAASYSAFASEANRLREQLPADVRAILTRHEAAGTTDDPEYLRACQVFYERHMCRALPWPEELQRSFASTERDPTVYHVMNGPSEFHITGSLRDWQCTDRLDLIEAPTLVLSGRYDEATPALQDVLVSGIPRTEQAIFEESSHMPFFEEPDAYLTTVASWLARHD